MQSFYCLRRREWTWCVASPRAWLPGLRRPLSRGNRNCIPGLICRRIQRKADPGLRATASTTSGLQAASPLMILPMRVQHPGLGRRHGYLCPSASRTTAATGRADVSTGNPRDLSRASLAAPRAGRSTRAAPERADHLRGESAAGDSRARGRSPLAELRASREPAARLQVLLNGLRIADSALPAEPDFARMTAEEQVSLFAGRPKPPEGLWIVAAKAARYDTRPDEKPILAVRIPSGKDAGATGNVGQGR